MRRTNRIDSGPEPYQVDTGAADPINPSTRFEPHDIDVTRVFLAGFGIVLGMFVICVIIYPFFSHLRWERAAASPPPTAAGRYGDPVPPEPRLQANPARDMREMRAQEDAALNSYRWVDRDRGMVSIPIQRAIKIVAERGIPPQPSAGPRVYFPPSAGSLLTGFERSAGTERK